MTLDMTRTTPLVVFGSPGSNLCSPDSAVTYERVRTHSESHHGPKCSKCYFTVTPDIQAGLEGNLVRRVGPLWSEDWIVGGPRPGELWGTEIH